MMMMMMIRKKENKSASRTHSKSEQTNTTIQQSVPVHMSSNSLFSTTWWWLFLTYHGGNNKRLKKKCEPFIVWVIVRLFTSAGRILVFGSSGLSFLFSQPPSSNEILPLYILIVCLFFLVNYHSILLCWLRSVLQKNLRRTNVLENDYYTHFCVDMKGFCGKKSFSNKMFWFYVCYREIRWLRGDIIVVFSGHHIIFLFYSYLQIMLIDSISLLTVTVESESSNFATCYKTWPWLPTTFCHEIKSNDDWNNKIDLFTFLALKTVFKINIKFLIYVMELR